MAVDQLLKICFFTEASKSFNHFAAFEKQQCWNCRNAVLHSEIHVLGDVDLSYFGVAVVIGCQLINDWTQSFARSSTLGVEIDQYWSLRTKHVRFERVGCEFCCHVYSPLI